MLRWSITPIAVCLAATVGHSAWADTVALEGTPASSAATSPTPPPAPAPAPPPPPAYAPGGPYQPPPGYPPGYYAPPPGYYPPYPPPPGYYRAYEPVPPPPDPPAKATHFGVGYKIGNGLGFLGGDLIISPYPHLVLDLQASTFSHDTSAGTATGYGLAPALQIHIREPGRSTPYLGIGYLYAHLSLGNVSASGDGVFLNAGYEWKWSSGMGILLGGGICYFGDIHATDGATTISREAELMPMLEAGIRFMFI